MAGSIRDRLMKGPLREKQTTSFANLCKISDYKLQLFIMSYLRENVRGTDLFQWRNVCSPSISSSRVSNPVNATRLRFVSIPERPI
jgi:hypothetical protein